MDSTIRLIENKNAMTSKPPLSLTPLKQTIPHTQWLAYRIGRGEQGVLTHEPYKSHLLPSWRFRTVPIAKESAAELWEKFKEFDAQDDFVGMDMARKFIQMGMTRAKRYANHAGGRKYAKSGGDEGQRVELPKSEGHAGKREKEEASLGYKRRKEVFLREQGEMIKAGDQSS
ncbi:hypothetical protein F5Y03DRAFT_407096 [Xylaria venustula]|nr:hypothetical protein F5Y03DRAFT_407096 [Xylaria venustula]